MGKLLSISLNQPLGILGVQEVQFSEMTDNLVTIKGGVGTGKTSVNNAIAIGLSAGNERSLPIDMKKYESVDIEEQILYNDVKLFLRTKSDNGKLVSSLYVKDVDGKKATNPVVNGKKLTPASLRDILKTELTFGIDAFISENPRTQMDFMMEVYKDKLKEKGIVFDKKSTNYYGSLLYQLDQAIAERSMKYNKVTELNAYKTRLEQEGYPETAIPEFVNIASIEAEQKELMRKYYESIADVDKRLSDVKMQAFECNTVIKSYNESLDRQRELADEKLRASVNEFNQSVDKMLSERTKIAECVGYLLTVGAPEGVLKAWVESLPAIPDKKVFVPTPELEKVPQNEKGHYIHAAKYSDEVEKAFAEIDSLRNKALELIKEKESIKEPSDTFTQRIESAKAINRIAERWAAFYEHQESDKKVKDIFNQYRKTFTEIDLGVDGLRMDIIGDESSTDIRTVYNGSHDPKLFGNEKMEYRNIASYSLTQRNILAILMQIHLLEEKKKRGEDGLRYIFIEAPLDKKTRDILIDMQKKYDMQILTSATGDYSVSGLADGEFLIEDGYLLSNKL